MKQVNYLMNETDYKIRRNIPLLEMELDDFVSEHQEEDLTEASAEVQNELGCLLYQLGKNYYLQQDYEPAVEYFEMGLNFNLDVKKEYVVDMVESYGFALINMNEAKSAIVLEAVYDEFSDHGDFCFMMGLVYLGNKQYEQAVFEFAKAASSEEEKILGATSYLAYYHAGIAREKQGKMEEAKEFFQKAGDYEEALKKL